MDSREQMLREQTDKLFEEGIIVSKELQKELREKIDSVSKFIEENKNVSGLSEKEKDAKYGESKELWSDFSNFLRSVEYTMTLTGAEFLYLRDLILKDMHYTEQSLFVALRVEENFFNDIKPADIKRDTTEYQFKIKIDDATLLHHLIKDHTVKGLNNKAYMFASILTEIGNISRIFNYWDGETKALSEKIHNWTLGLDEASQPQEEQIEELEVEEVKDEK
jgi:hypothetical protein